MNPSDLGMLQARLRRLECRLVILAVAWILTLAALALLGPWTPRAVSQSQVVRATALEIVDRAGRIGATLDSVNRKPSLWLYGEDGGRRAGLTVGPGGTPELVLVDMQGTPRISLRVGAERAAEIRVADSRGHTRLGVWVDYNDEPGIWMLDELTRPRIGLKVLSGGVPRLWIFDQTTGRVTFTAP